jgi:pilus assembly protein Flp/PilA
MATFPEHPFMRLVIRFLKDEKAATAIEYAVIAAGIALAIIATVKGVGTKVNTIFSSV